MTPRFTITATSGHLGYRPGPGEIRGYAAPSAFICVRQVAPDWITGRLDDPRSIRVAERYRWLPWVPPLCNQGHETVHPGRRGPSESGCSRPVQRWTS